MSHRACDDSASKEVGDPQKIWEIQEKIASEVWGMSGELFVL